MAATPSLLFKAQFRLVFSNSAVDSLFSQWYPQPLFAPQPFNTLLLAQCFSNTPIGASIATLIEPFSKYFITKNTLYIKTIEIWQEGPFAAKKRLEDKNKTIFCSRSNCFTDAPNAKSKIFTAKKIMFYGIQMP